jgi:hypothetical protein
MTGSGHDEVGNFTLHPNMLKIVFKHAPDERGKPGNRKNPLFGKKLHKNSSQLRSVPAFLP